MAWRSLAKNKIAAVINIGGLSVGLATSIIIMLVVMDELSFDKFNVNLKDICILMKHHALAGETSTGRTMPGPLAASLRSEIPELKYVVRTSQRSRELIGAGDKSLYQNGIYAEPDYFNMMTFPALEGDPVAALRDPGAVVLTESTAKRLFGTENAMGKMLLRNNVTSLKVGAVIRDIPQNSYTRFDMVLPFTLYERENNWLNKWDDNRIFTWIQMSPNANLAVLNEKLKKFFIEKQEEKNITLFAYPLADLRLHGRFRNGHENGGSIETVRILSFIGLFVLLIACINFMNLATARSERRAREVGVRKVMGASRRRLIFQFLSEAMLLSLVAMIIGFLLAWISLPAAMQLIGKTFSPSFFNWQVILLVVGMGLFTGLVAGSYPAFFLSNFQPVKVLKRLQSGGKGDSLLRKGLVTFQFIISIFLIIVTIVTIKQIHYVEQRPMGYDQENLVEIQADGDMRDKFDIVKNYLQEIPGVTSVSAGSDDLVSFGSGMNGLEWPGKTPDQDFGITVANVQYNWVKTVGFKLVEGRDFSPAYGADDSACLINQTAVKKMGLKAPIVGTRLGDRTVIGVLQDFVFNNPASAPQPMIVNLQKKDMSHFFVRIVNNGNWQECIARMEEVVKKNNPGFPFVFHFTKDEYQKSFEDFRAVGQMANVFGGMAIFISCLGLFGLSAFLAERRNKEVSIRKVFGASLGSLWFSLSKDFLKPVFIAFLFAAPLAGWVMQKMLLKMDYHIQLSWWMFVAGGVLAIVVAVLTISFHGMKTALANPVKSLRAE
ncbi:hypothetical protein MMC2321_02171 [Chitinophaga sp. MM2321]